MLRKFSKPLLRFPVKWANAVTDWLLGLTSDGSLTILNSASPATGTPKISVNPAWLAAQITGTASSGRPVPFALAVTAGTSQSAESESPARSNDYWAYGLAYKTDGTTKANSANERDGFTFDVVTRSVKSALTNYLYFRTITVSPLGVIVAVSKENKCVAVVDKDYM